MITVLVFNKNTGNPALSVKVALGKDGFLSGGITNGEWTDSRGEVHFDVANGSGQIFVQGRSLFQGYLAGRHVIYI